MLSNTLKLFVFEGAKCEPDYFNSLEHNILGELHQITCVYNTVIYDLYEKMTEDGFAIDIVNVLRDETTKENHEILHDYNRESFSEIYLFFDYDGHATNADDRKTYAMLSFFNDETGNGKLYLSYPMVEAIRHFQDIESFKELTVKCKRGKSFDEIKCPYKDDCEEIELCLHEPTYKEISSKCCPELSHIGSFNKKVWKEIILANIMKMNYIVNDSFSIPIDYIPQDNVFLKQKQKYIDYKCPRVAVLSAFPLYFLDYLGIEKALERI